MKIKFSIIFINLFILGLHSNIFSQEGLSIGIKAGAGFSQFFFQNYVEQDFVPVFQGGIVISHQDKRNLGVQFEILKTQKAWQEAVADTFKRRVIIDYIELPLYSTFKIGKKKSAIVITAGLHISRAINVDTSSYYQEFPDTLSLITYTPLKYSKWNYGIGGGIGYQLSLGRNHFQIQLNYSQGMQNLFERNYSKIYRSLSQNLYLNFIYRVSLAKHKSREAIKPKESIDY